MVKNRMDAKTPSEITPISFKLLFLRQKISHILLNTIF